MTKILLEDTQTQLNEMNHTLRNENICCEASHHQVIHRLLVNFPSKPTELASFSNAISCCERSWILSTYHEMPTKQPVVSVGDFVFDSRINVEIKNVIISTDNDVA